MTMLGTNCGSGDESVVSSLVSLSAGEADAALVPVSWPPLAIPLDAETRMSLGLEEIGAGLAGDGFDWAAATAASVASAVAGGAGWVWPDVAVPSPLLDD
jgi:hypothetical protein